MKYVKEDKQPCEVCGDEDTQGHHENYMEPDKLMWLCRKHHMQRQTQLRRLGKDLNRVHSTAATARLLGVGDRTIARWIREGKIKAVKFGRVWRVPASEILRVMKEGF